MHTHTRGLLSAPTRNFPFGFASFFRRAPCAYCNRINACVYATTVTMCSIRIIAGTCTRSIKYRAARRKPTIFQSSTLTRSQIVCLAGTHSTVWRPVGGGSRVAHISVRNGEYKHTNHVSDEHSHTHTHRKKNSRPTYRACRTRWGWVGLGGCRFLWW